jgi:hypothetical protein
MYKASVANMGPEEIFERHSNIAKLGYKTRTIGMGPKEMGPEEIHEMHRNLYKVMTANVSPAEITVMYSSLGQRSGLKQTTGRYDGGANQQKAI